MVTGKSDIVDVELEPRIVKEKAQAFFAGKYEESKGKKREVWIWLPLSQIEVGEKNDRGCATVTMPEWLAIDKGLV